MDLNKTPPVNNRPYMPFMEVWGGFLFGFIVSFSLFVKFDFIVPPVLNAVLGDFGVLVLILLLCALAGLAGSVLAQRQWEKRRRFPLIAGIGYALFAIFYLLLL